MVQGAAVEAWKEATSMRKMGREPSRVDLASFFADADADAAAAAANITKAEALPLEVPLPSEQGRKAKKTARFAPGALEDYTVKAGVSAPPRVRDYSVRAGSTARPAPGAAGAAGELGHAAAMDRSVRFARNIAATPDDFAARFGPYQRRLEAGDASGSGRAEGVEPGTAPGPGFHRHADPSVRFRDAVAPADGGFASKFGAYSDDPRAIIPGDSGHGPGERPSPPADGRPAKPNTLGFFGRRAPGARLSLDQPAGAPERSPAERGMDAANPADLPQPSASGAPQPATASPDGGAPSAAYAPAWDGAEHPGWLPGGGADPSPGRGRLPRLPEGHRASMDTEGRVKGARDAKSSLAAAAAQP